MYWQADVIVEGALDASEVFENEDDLDTFIDAQKALAAQDGLETELYLMPHPHAMDSEDCSCVQLLTDHHPDFVWNGRQ